MNNSMSLITDFISNINFYEIKDVMLNTGMYQYLLPFLLMYAILYTVLPFAKIFKKKKGDKEVVRKKIVILVSLIISLTVAVYPINDNGDTVFVFIKAFFPSVSTITIGLLGLYLVNSLLGKHFLDFFGGMNRSNAYAYFAVVILMFGSMIFFLGIAAGFWDYNILDPRSQWNFAVIIGLLILSIIFLAIGLYAYGVILLLVFATFVYNYGNANVLELIFDPFIFIISLVIILFSWVNSGEDPIKELEKSLKGQEKSLRKYLDQFNNMDGKEKKTKWDISKIFWIIAENYLDNLKKYKKLTGKEWDKGLSPEEIERIRKIMREDSHL